MRRLLPLFAVVLMVQLVDAVPRAWAASSTFVVTTTADPLNDPTTTCSPGPSGPCTLRQAINSANANSNPADQDSIRFDIDGAGPHTINLTSDLPPVTQSVLIDGETETGAQCAAPRTLMIEISGEGEFTGLVLNHAENGATTGSEVRGMALNRNNTLVQDGFLDFTKANGLTISNGTGHVAECLHIGTNVAGDTARGNVRHGIWVLAPTTSPRIGGNTAAERNIISGNAQDGIMLEGTSPIVQGNYIGVGADGVTAIGNSAGGISVFSADNAQIGGTATGEGNVISGTNAISGTGATGHGIAIGVATNLEVRGNHIGVSADGTVAVPNSRHGIFVQAEFSNQPITGLVISDNVISGNKRSGIELWEGAPEARIFRNIIGLNAAGTAAIRNGEYGVVVTSMSESPVSGTQIGVDGGNVISGNGEDGILILGPAVDTIIQQNFIGYAADGTTEIPNDGHGIWFLATLDQVGGLIGGIDSIGANRIYAAARGLDIGNGIALEQISGPTGPAPRAIEIGANSIRSEGHAINLIPFVNNQAEAPNTVTPNDPGPDSDSGPNRLQNHPILHSASSGDALYVLFTLVGAPHTDYILRFYASATCNDANARQAARYLGRVTISTFVSGTYHNDDTLEAGVAEGEFITMTATREPGISAGLLSDLPDNDTSELSNCVAAGTAQDGIGTLLPADVVAGTPAFQLKVLGNGFPVDAVINWNGTPITTVRINAEELNATVPASILGPGPGTALISVTASGGFPTDSLPFGILRSSSDINCDGTANAADALDLLRELAGLQDNANACSSNADQDGGVDMFDVLWIRAEVAGLIPIHELLAAQENP